MAGDEAAEAFGEGGGGLGGEASVEGIGRGAGDEDRPEEKIVKRVKSCARKQKNRPRGGEDGYEKSGRKRGASGAKLFFRFGDFGGFGGFGGLGGNRGGSGGFSFVVGGAALLFLNFVVLLTHRGAT